MRRVDLLPAEDRGGFVDGLPGGILAILLVAAAAVLIVLVVIYLVLLLRLNGIEDEVANLDGQISAGNTRLEELAPYSELQGDLNQKKPVADGIFRTRFAWAEFLNGLSFVVPETTALLTLTGEAAPVDIDAPAGQPLEPPGAVTFTGVALDRYQNVADFVVRMNNLERLSNAQLNSAELDRDTFEQPAIEFEVASELVTVSGERGTEVRIGGGDPTDVASAGTPADEEAPDRSPRGVASAASPSRSQYAAAPR